MRRRALLALGAAAAVAVAAAGGSAAEEPGGHTGSGAETSAVINDRTVSPLELVVAPGSRVTWVNVGIKRHTITSDTGSFDSGTMLPGESFSIVAPTEIEHLTYTCRFHAYIKGSITVSPVDLRAPESVAYGRRATISGSVPGAPTGGTIVIERRVGGVWTALLTVPLALDGRFVATTPELRGRMALRAQAGEHVSPTAEIGARTLVVARRVRGALAVRVAPARVGLEVRLQRLDLDTYAWRTIGSAQVDRRGRARLPTPGGGVYRAVLPHGVPGVDGAASAAVPVRR